MKGNQSMKIEQVVVVGGTHGNEFLGPYLIEKINQSDLYKDSPVKVQTLLANPDAFSKSVRFIDHDLNRCFNEERLDSHNQSIEIQRAQTIKQQLGANNQRQFVIDLHSTTSNMGLTLIVRDDIPFNLHAAAYVQQQVPEVRIIISDSATRSPALCNIYPWGLTIEVGPIPNGVVQHDLFDATKKMTGLLIKFLSLCKTRDEPRLPDSIDVYRMIEKVPYPRHSSGALAGMIHQDFQNRNFRLLEPGQMVFHRFDGDDVIYRGRAGYPIFINEAAYYRENVAFMLTERESLPLPPL